LNIISNETASPTIRIVNLGCKSTNESNQKSCCRNINFVRRPVALHDRGQTLTVTSYDDDADRTDGDVVNQIVYAYDGWGNVATSWQAHDGKVDNDGLDGDDSPSVQYGYDSLARLASVTYPTDPPGAPTNRVVGYSYGVATSMDYRLSRVSSITDGVTKKSGSTFNIKFLQVAGLGRV